MTLRVAFVRQVFGSEWAQRSRACIQREFPGAPIIELPGTPPKAWTSAIKPALDQCYIGDRLRRRSKAVANGDATEIHYPDTVEARTRNSLWMLRQYLFRRFTFDPLRPVMHGLTLRADYLVHIDEDCFLTDGPQLRRVIDFMDANPDILIAGPADGGTPFREDRNPFACNLFFNVIRVQPMRQLMRENANWRRLRFKDIANCLPSDAPKRETPERPVPCDEPYNLDDYEPYYPLYWLVLKTGHAIKYLPVRMTGDERRASAVRFSDADTDMCFHMWYMREWVAGNNLSVYGVPNSDRYECARRILARYGIA